MKKRVFVLDYDEVLLELLRYLFEGREYEVLTFSDPEFCHLHNLGNCPCKDKETCGDIIISDINMPSVNGLEFVESLKKTGCKVKNVALMSGSWSRTDVEKATSLGCRVFHKPLSIADIEEWLDDCEKGIDPERILTNCFKETRVQEEE